MHRFQTHKDKEATKARKYRSRYSYVSTNGHEYLAGADKLERVREVYRRDKVCVDCGTAGSYIAGNLLQYSHRGHRKMERCDCFAECGPKIRCRLCHLKYDGNRVPRFSEVKVNA